MKNSDFYTKTSPAHHAVWRIKGIKKYLPVHLNASTQVLWNEFVAWSRRVRTEADITRFEHDLEKRFLANQVLKKAFWKRVFEEDRIFQKAKAQLSGLKKSIELLKSRLES